MDPLTLTIDNSVSKKPVMEEMSLYRAWKEDAENWNDEADSISNERITKGISLRDTYKVLSDAIQGGMGSVWRVHHKDWNVDLAMKRPNPRFFAEGSQQRKEEFIAECENWINLGLHPNIVSCYYVRDIGGVPSIFSEWMENGSLKDRIKDCSLYEGTEKEVQKRILDIAIQITRGLQYAHESDLVHQDIKPGNILMTGDWDAKIADFGLAKAQSRLRVGDQPMSTGYTLPYCPREQAEGAAAQQWMDVYAWALTVLEMYAGQRLWQTGGEVPEKFDSYAPLCRHPLPDSMKNLIRSALTEKNDDFRQIEKALLDIYRKTTGTAYPRSNQKTADNMDLLNNRALSFLDMGKPEYAVRIWEELPDHAYSACNYTVYRFINGIIGLDECLERLKGIYESDHSLSDIAAVIEDLEKRTAPPEWKCCSEVNDDHCFDTKQLCDDTTDVFVGDRHIRFKRRLFEKERNEYGFRRVYPVKDTYDVYEIDKRGNETFLYTENRFEAKYHTLTGIEGFKIYFSASGRRYLTVSSHSVYSDHNCYSITDSLTGEDLIGQNLPSCRDGWIHGAFAVDDEDKFMLHITNDSKYGYDLKLFWYDLTHKGRNSFVWRADIKPEPHEVRIYITPGGTRTILLCGKEEGQYLCIPVPEDNDSPKYVLSKVLSLRDTVEQEEQCDKVMAEIKGLLDTHHIAEALEKWNAAHALSLFPDHPDYESVEDRIDLMCCRKSMRSRVKVGEYKKLDDERPVFVWRRNRSEELILSLQLRSEISRSSQRGGIVFDKGTGNILNPIKHQAFLIVRRSDGSLLSKFELSSLNSERFEKVERVEASPDGSILAVHLIMQNPPGMRLGTFSGLLILKVSGTKAYSIMYFQGCKQFEGGIDNMLMTDDGLYIWNKQQKSFWGGGTKVFFLKAPTFDRIKTFTSANLPDVNMNTNRWKKERSSCRMEYRINNTLTAVEKYARHFEYELPQYQPGRSEALEPYIEVFRAINKGKSAFDAAYCCERLSRMGFGYISPEELRV